METKPLLPPFTLKTAKAKVQAAENAWNTRNPDLVALAYTEDSEWRNRHEFVNGRDEIREFLKRKWAKELDYRLRRGIYRIHVKTCKMTLKVIQGLDSKNMIF